MAKSICRLCLKEGFATISLFKDGIQMLEALTLIKIECDSNTKNSACTQCYLNLKLAHKIQQDFIKCNQKFLLMSENSYGENNSLEYLDSEEKTMELDSEINEVVTITKEEVFEDVLEPVGMIEENENITIETTEAEFISQENEDIIIGDIIEETKVVSEETEDTERTAVDIKEFSCEICGIKLPINESLEHIKQHFNGPQNCDDCQKTFLNLDHYKAHTSRMHKNYPKIWTCKDCKLVFNYKSLFNIHKINFHKNSKDIKPHSLEELMNVGYVLPVNKCPIDKSLTDTLTNNISEKLACPECNKMYTDPKQYKIHLKMHRRRKCGECGKMVTSYNYHKHVANHLTNPVICHVCGVNCKNAQSLRMHINVYHKNKIFPCEYCEKTFKRGVVRDVHARKRHTGEKPFICDTCAKGFFTQKELKCHIKMVHLKLRPHVCKFCEKGFSSKYAMVTHMRQHTNELPFKCEVCGEGFRQRVSLNSHLKSKHDIEEEKTLECDVCSKMFATKAAVFCHKQRMH